MGNLNYEPLIRDMTWSFSRVASFGECPYRWFLTYIREKPDEDRFYASYGTFVHKLLARFYRGELPKEKLVSEFLSGFRDEVKGTRPSPEIASKYVKEGADYFRNFRPFECEVVGVEKQIDFDVLGIPFTGYIDLLVKTEDGLFIVDHKSRVVKPRDPFSHRVTKADEIREEMLLQLYLYAEAVRQSYGEYPAALVFNCFRNGTTVEELFDEEKCRAALRWAKESVEEITKTEDFEANPEWFRCRWLCGRSRWCEEGWET